MISLPLLKCVLSKHHLLAPEGAKLQRMDRWVGAWSYPEYLDDGIYPNVQKYFRMYTQNVHPPEI